MYKKRAFCFHEECRMYRIFLVLAPGPKAESVVPNSFKAKKKRSRGDNKTPKPNAERRDRIDIVCTVCGTKAVMLGCDHHPDWTYVRIGKDNIDIGSYDPPTSQDLEEEEQLRAVG